MSKISNIKRLIKEDFAQKDQDLIDKLAYVLNPFLDQVTKAFNKGINIDNLSREFVYATVVNTAGILAPSVQIKTKLASKMIGINVIKADNTTNPGTYPTNAIGLSWTVEKDIITLNKVTGIQDGQKYNLVLELIS